MVAPGGRAKVPTMPNAARSRRSRRLIDGKRGSEVPFWSIGLLGCVLGLLLAGCDRNIEPYQPGEEPRAPDLARIFPGPPGGVGSRILSMAQITVRHSSDASM